MATKIQKWGNSLAVRLPKEIAQELSLEEGSDVEFAPRLHELVIRRVRKPQAKLKDLLAKLEPQQLHQELDWGKPFGKELW